MVAASALYLAIRVHNGTWMRDFPFKNLKTSPVEVYEAVTDILNFVIHHPTHSALADYSGGVNPIESDFNSEKHDFMSFQIELNQQKEGMGHGRLNRHRERDLSLRDPAIANQHAIRFLTDQSRLSKETWIQSKSKAHIE